MKKTALLAGIAALSSPAMAGIGLGLELGIKPVLAIHPK